MWLYLRHHQNFKLQWNFNATTSTPLSKPLECNTTANTPSLELPNCIATTSTLSSRLPNYNIAFTNGSKNCMQFHGTWKCKESKYLKFSSSLGPFNLININSNSLKQKFHMQKLWKFMCIKRIMQKYDQEVDCEVETIKSKWNLRVLFLKQSLIPPTN
jgi:hypothetical protein